MDKYINMDKILISFGTRPLAQRVGHLLSEKFQIVYATCEPFPALLKQQAYQVIPEAEASTYAHEILKLCLDAGIHYVLPLGLSELKPLQEARLLLEEYGVSLLIPEDLAAYPQMHSPVKELPIAVYNKGVDMCAGKSLPHTDFSGLGLLSDSEDSLVLALL